MIEDNYRKRFIETFRKRVDIDIENKMISYYWFEIMEEKDKEIERLNNIINELEKRLIFDSKENNEDYIEEYLKGCIDEATIILDYLQELKGSDK